jgi:prevent-host-death family protein
MIELPVVKVKNQLSELLVLVEAGEEISVTRRGVPVARLVAARAADSKSAQRKVADAFQQLRRLRAGAKLDGDIKTVAREGLA